VSSLEAAISKATPTACSAPGSWARKKNNGVLFLIAPNERKMRIEVGYGLEGVLTDAVSSVIIRSAVAPRFKSRDFSGGIEAASTRSSTFSLARHQRVDEARDEQSMSETIDQLAPIILFVLVHVHHDLHVRATRAAAAAAGR